MKPFAYIKPLDVEAAVLAAAAPGAKFLGGAAVRRLVRWPAEQQPLGLTGPPRLGSNASERQPDLSHGLVLHLQRRGDRDERERVGRPVADLAVSGAGRQRWRQLNRGDQLPRRQRVLDMWGVAGKAVEISHRNAASPAGATDLNDGIQSRQCHAHVGGMCCNAGLAHPEDGVAAVESVERVATAVRLAFVASCCRVVEVRAASPL